MRIRVFEMTYKRPKIKDAIDDHVQQIAENWCLIWAAKQYRQHLETINHWAGELVAQFDPGLRKLAVSDLSPRARHKLIDEVLYSDAKLDRVGPLVSLLDRKFEKEGWSESQLEEAVQAWVKEGLPSVRAVYRGEIRPAAYERQLCSIEQESGT